MVFVRCLFAGGRGNKQIMWESAPHPPVASCLNGTVQPLKQAELRYAGTYHGDTVVEQRFTEDDDIEQLIDMD